MPRGRVLVVDDSVVARKIVSQLLLGDPAIESVVTAPNGRLALERFELVNPNLVILDVEMPELDGIATLRELRRRAPGVPVLMFSGLTERAGALTLDALSLGASDYVTKPTAGPAVPVTLQRVHDELLAKARALLKQHGSAPLPPQAAAPAPPPKSRAARVELLAIGASTGGPTAIEELLGALARALPVPVVIVQHMPPLFTRLFAERLSALTGLVVREGAMGERLLPGEVWVAPGDFHLAVRRDGPALLLHMHQGPPENSCRPSVDVLFRSVAEACGPSGLGVVLTGMGSDGQRGSEAMRAAGGQVVVQDEATSVVWSMPGSVAAAGLADEVLPLGLLGPALMRRLRGGREGAAP